MIRPVLVCCGLLGAVAVAEIAVFWLVAELLGLPGALLALLVTSAVGGWALRREGVRGWRRLRAAVDLGQAPGPAMAQGLSGLLAGLLLILPGFVTDLVGAALLTPAGRRGAARGLHLIAERRGSPRLAGLFGPRRIRVHRGPSGADEAVEGQVIDPATPPNQRR